MVFENDQQKDKRKYNRRETSVQMNSIVGRIPPQEISLEQVILGALISQPASQNVWASIRPEMFYETRHQKIFNAIYELKIDDNPIDELTVGNKLKAFGELEMIGGFFYITELTKNTTASAINNIEYNILIVHQAFLKRELIRIATEVISNMYDDSEDPFDQIKSIISQIKDLEKGIFRRSEKNTTQLVDELIEEMNRPKVDGLLGYPTGLVGLDSVTKGDKKGSLRVVAAATSIGKSVEMCSEVTNGCYDQSKNLKKQEDQIPTAVFSLEMTSLDLTFRFVSNISSVNGTNIQTGELSQADKEQLKYKLEEFKQAKIFIDDTPGLSINEFEAKAAILAAMGIERFYIDYYQLMKCDPYKKYGTREQELSDIGARLKTCAKELNVAIILLAQVGDLDKKPGGMFMPGLNDLRDCKALGLHADIVMFIWRPEFHESLLESLKNNETKIYCQLFNITIDNFENMCFLIVAKNRSGKLGKIPVKFSGGLMRISDNSEVLEAIANQKTNQQELTTEQREATF